MKDTKQKVMLSVIGSKDKKKKAFPIEQALRLIGMKNPSWELNDDNYTQKGSELIKK